MLGDNPVPRISHRSETAIGWGTRTRTLNNWTRTSCVANYTIPQCAPDFIGGRRVPATGSVDQAGKAFKADDAAHGDSGDLANPPLDTGIAVLECDRSLDAASIKPEFVEHRN